MASIEKQQSGRYRARYRDVHGRGRSLTFARRIDAEAFIDQTNVDIRRDDWIDPSARRVLFPEWADDWWATTIKLRPNTRRGYWLLLKNHVLLYFKDYRLTEIDYLDVERFIGARLKAGHGPKQVPEMVTVLSLIMRVAIRANARRDNPASGHSLPVQRRSVRQSQLLTWTSW